MAGVEEGLYLLLVLWVDEYCRNFSFMLNQALKLIYFLSAHKYYMSAFCKPRYVNILAEIPIERKWQNSM